MEGLQFYVLDVETTGIKNTYHEITELSIIRVGNTPKESIIINRNVKCKYPKRANIEALRITNKTIYDLYKGDSKDKVVQDCNYFFNLDKKEKSHRCIIAHNCSFDMGFVHKMWEECGEVFPVDNWVDSMKLVSAYAKSNGLEYALSRGKIKLQDSCTLLGINKVAGAHNTESDTKNTFLLWKKLLEHNVDYLKYIKCVPHKIATLNSISDPYDFDPNEDIDFE